MMNTILDLRNTKCPLNFVKAKLALEKLAVGEELTVWIHSDGESAINIPNSIAQEGHTVVQRIPKPDGTEQLVIQKQQA